MIRFKTLHIEGFGIFAKPKTINLDRPGINILALSNGSGKSTVFGALVWALYGKPLKSGSTIESYVNMRPPDWQGTMVQVVFEMKGHSYKVVRCKDYKGKVNGFTGKNQLFIFKDSKPLSQDREKRLVEVSLKNLLGYSFELFTNSVIFPQRAKRFIEERGADKRKIFEEIFNLSWILAASEEAKTLRKQYEDWKATLIPKHSANERAIQEKESFLAKVGEIKRDFEKDRGDRIRMISTKIQDTQQKLDNWRLEDTYELGLQVEELTSKKLKNWDTIKNSLEATKHEITKYQNLKSRLEVKLSQVLESLQHYREHSEYCETCGQEITPDKKGELVEELTLTKGTTKAQLREVTRKIDDLVLDRDTLNKTHLEYHDINLQVAELNSQIKQNQLRNNHREFLKESLEGFQKDLEAVNKEEFKDITPHLSKEIDTLKGQLETSRAQLRKLDYKIKVANWAIKQVFSETGIKTFILHSMIERLNRALKHYEKFVNFGVRLEIEMDKARKDINTVITREGFPVLLEDLSGGERQLVNIVVAFALRDLLASPLNGNTTNLQVFDEVFESLDPSNTELVSDLVQERVDQNTTVFLVTHKVGFMLRNSNSYEL
jgi:DNA repair exonuclease SbcCD ATPase subunit